MQCFKIFLANELFHIFDIKFADPVIEVSYPKNHTKVGSTKMKRRAYKNTVSQAYQNNLYLKKENIFMVSYSCFKIVCGGVEGSD